MDADSERRKGEWLVFSNIFLWGLFPVFTALSLTFIPSLVSYTWSSTFAALFFAIVITFRRKWFELRNHELWKYGMGILLFIGILYYGFYFIGLSYTTPGNAAIISLFEVFTSFVFFHVLRREHISGVHILGAALMVIGAVIVLGRNFAGINTGDVLILLATLASPAGNLYQQKARQVASSESVMFLRTLTTVPAAFLLASLFGMSASSGEIRSALIILILNGVLFFGLQKVLWIEAIHRISVTKSVALSSLAPLVTLVAAWALLNQAPTPWQLLSLVPFVLGTLLLTDQIGFKRM